MDANANECTDEIEFAADLVGTINLTSGQLMIADALIINGPGEEVLTISGSGESRVILVSGASVDMNDVSIANEVATDLVADNPDLSWFASGVQLPLLEIKTAANCAICETHAGWFNQSASFIRCGMAIPLT